MKLLNDVIEAHGGMNHWRQFCMIEAQIVSGGNLFEEKGVPQDSITRDMTVWTHQQKASVRPFGAPNQKSNFTSSRVAIETFDGKVIAERKGEPKEIIEHLKGAKWDPLDRAYFNGYALWMYLTTPFFMIMPGMEVNEISPLKEGDEVWKGLSVKFPSNMATHSEVQNFYFSKDNLIRRHDYHVDAGNFYAAQYISDLKVVQGLVVAGTRRAYKKDDDGNPIKKELMVKIDLSNFKFS